MILVSVISMNINNKISIRRFHSDGYEELYLTGYSQPTFRKTLGLHLQGRRLSLIRNQLDEGSKELLIFCDPEVISDMFLRNVASLVGYNTALSINTVSMNVI
jgi:hypothetical protein